MDTTTAHVIALAFMVSGGAVVAIVAVAVAALRRAGTGPITAEGSAEVTVAHAGRDVVKPARLPDTEIAALEDALAYLAAARDGCGEEAARAVAMAAFILQQRRAGQYRPNTTVAQLNALFAARAHRNGRGAP